jgi:hypothetical protein
MRLNAVLVLFGFPRSGKRRQEESVAADPDRFERFNGNQCNDLNGSIFSLDGDH